MSLIAELNRLQHEHGWLREADLRALSERIGAPLFRIQGVMSFYPHFRTTPPPRVEVAVCRDMCCHMAGGKAACADLKRRLAGRKDVQVHEVSCLGRCDDPPAATINGVPWTNRDPARTAALVDKLDELPLDEPTGVRRKFASDPYETITEHYSVFRALPADMTARRTEIVKTLKDSGLRGMGGAGFPTGAKWEMVAGQAATPKYVICNADESEPGTFKDRLILEELSHLVIEGMLIACRVVGANKAIVYIRHEYTRERKALEAQVAWARKKGVIPADIEFEVFVSPGGYILGEETALLEALEDKRGEPRNKPPFPGQSGLFGKPTLINNVETFSYVPTILKNGADWWKAQGVRGCPGLKFISVSGDVKTRGNFQVPMGTTVRELIDKAGGCTGKLYAFAPGGASSNFLPAAKADVPLDFKALADAGSMLGSGALLVVAEGTDLVDLAANIVRFFRNESCGKCVPCRVGSEKSVELLDQVLAGRAGKEAFDQIAAMGETMTQTSICGLGQVAVNPILSVVKNFPEAAAKHARS